MHQFIYHSNKVLMRIFLLFYFLFLIIFYSEAQIKKIDELPNFPIQTVQKKVWNENKDETKKDTLWLIIDDSKDILTQKNLKKDTNNQFEFRRTEKRIFDDKKEGLIKLKVGFGNYMGVVWGFYLKNTINNHTTYEFDASQNARRNGVVAGRLSGENDLRLALKVYFHYDSLYHHIFDVSYETQKRGFYGYQNNVLEQSQQDTILFRWQKVRLQGYTFTKASRHPAHAKYFFQYLNRRDMTETQFGIEIMKSWKVNPTNNFNMIANLAGLDYDTNINSISRSNLRTWWNTQFQWKATHKRLEYEANAGVVLHNDSINNPVNPYLNVNASYQFNKKLRLKTNVGNQIIQRNLDNTRQENPFLSPLLRLRNDDITFLELKGEYFLKPNWSIQLQIGQNTHQYRALFYNIKNDTAKFSVFYDRIIEQHLKINTLYQEKESELSMQMSFFNYQTTTQKKTWHLPDFTLLLGWRFRPYQNRWNFYTQIEILSGIQVLLPSSLLTNKLLQPIANAKLEAEYTLVKKFSAFFSINNLFFQKYERYLSYIQVPFHFTIGLKYELRR